jgi:hypothetical protein
MEGRREDVGVVGRPEEVTEQVGPGQRRGLLDIELEKDDGVIESAIADTGKSTKRQSKLSVTCFTLTLCASIGPYAIPGSARNT